MKTRIRPNILKISVLCWGFSALSCQSTHEELSQPDPNPNHSAYVPYRSLTIEEVIPSDDIKMTSTQTFECSAGKLTNYTGKQTYERFEFELTNHSSIVYKDNEAILTDASQTVSTYTLNPYGYATRCIRQEAGGDKRTYTFSYIIDPQDKHYLQEINEMLSDEKIFSHLTIERDKNYSISSIRQEINDQVSTYQFTTDESKETENTSEIPHPFLVEIHPLSMHLEALYGKLLGEPCPYMKRQVIPGENEHVTFDFSLNKEAWFTSCKITTTRNTQKYTRNISYSFISNE